MLNLVLMFFYFDWVLNVILDSICFFVYDYEKVFFWVVKGDFLFMYG